MTRAVRSSLLALILAAPAVASAAITFAPGIPIGSPGAAPPAAATVTFAPGDPIGPNGAPAVPSAPLASRPVTPAPAPLATSEGVANWVSLTPAAPGAREATSAVFDPVRHQMVVIAGWNGAALSETWVFSLGARGTWTRLDPDGTRPPARYAHTCVYDSKRDRFLVFGGNNGNGLYNDVWALDLSHHPRWEALAPAGTPPTQRFGHTAVYDPVGDRMIVFGGWDGHYLNDLWELRLDGDPVWAPLVAAGTPPSLRDFPIAEYDPNGARVILFGGNADGALGDTWSLDLSGDPTWVPLAPAGTPPTPRLLHKSGYDPEGHAIFVMGGWDGGKMVNDVYRLSLDDLQWTNVTPDGDAPNARSDHALVFDADANRLVLFGGRNLQIFFGDTWDLPVGGAWRRLSDRPPPGRMLHRAVWDALTDRIVVMGGYDGNGNFLDDTWALPVAGPAAWAPVIATGPLPPPRSDHSVIVDPSHHRLVMYGGRNFYQFFDDLWTLSLDAPAWNSIPASGPGAREAHTAVYDATRGRMLMFGGWNGANLQDTWSLSLDDVPQWSAVPTAGPTPAPRYAHAAVYDPEGDRMIVIGGFDGQTIMGDVWSLDLSGDTPTWSALAPQGEGPSPRYGSLAIADPEDHRILLIGGYDGAVLDDVWELRLTPALRWRRLPIKPGDIPAPRDFFGAALASREQRIVLFGGNDLSHAFQDTWALDLSTGSHNQAFDVGRPDAGVAIARVLPNPVRASASVELSTSSGDPFVVEVLDSAGRLQDRREVRGLGPGVHRVDLLRRGTAAPGIYFIRVRQGGRSATTRFAVLQ